MRTTSQAEPEEKVRQRSSRGDMDFGGFDRELATGHAKRPAADDDPEGNRPDPILDAT